MTTGAFNIGDRVEVLPNAPEQYSYRQATVVEINDSSGGLWPIGVKFQEDGKTHWFDEKELKLLNPMQEEVHEQQHDQRISPRQD